MLSTPSYSATIHPSPLDMLVYILRQSFVVKFRLIIPLLVLQRCKWRVDVFGHQNVRLVIQSQLQVAYRVCVRLSERQHSLCWFLLAL